MKHKPSPNTTIPRGKVRLCCNIDKATNQSLKLASSKHGITRTRIVENALRLHLSYLLTNGDKSVIMSLESPAKQ
jgi:hypothetical protein